jgi:hypothetical protein
MEVCVPATPGSSSFPVDSVPPPAPPAVSGAVVSTSSCFTGDGAGFASTGASTWGPSTDAGLSGGGDVAISNRTVRWVVPAGIAGGAAGEAGAIAAAASFIVAAADADCDWDSDCDRDDIDNMDVDRAGRAAPPPAFDRDLADGAAGAGLLAWLAVLARRGRFDGRPLLGTAPLTLVGAFRQTLRG